LYFNNHNETNSFFLLEHNNNIWYWYLIMATCFSLFRPSPGQRTHCCTFYLCRLAWRSSKKRL